MQENSPKDLFLESLNRCTQNEEFVPSFYKRFMASSEEIQRKFRFTNFEVQNRMLLRSLKLTAMATEGDKEGLRELTERAKTHDRDHLNIKPELYDLWKTAVTETAKEFDDKWNEPIEKAWDKILGYVINHMARKY